MENQIYHFVNGRYLPSDPATHDRNIPHARDQVDASPIPLDIRDAANIMPTPRGYSSFFGVTKSFGQDPLPPRVDDLFIVKDELGNNYAVALAETGVYMQDGDLSTPLGTISGDAFEVQNYEQ